MSPELEQRVRLVFPNGNDQELDRSQFVADTGGRLQRVFDQVQQLLPVIMSMGFSNDRSFEFVVTDSAAPNFEQWLSMKNPDKLNWIVQGGGKSYVACWYTASRVANYYKTWINHWRPHGDTGYLDALHSEEPSATWQQWQKEVARSMSEHGFALATREVWNERVPFITTWGGDEISEDDPRWDEDDFEPPPVLATLYDCLFGDQ